MASFIIKPAAEIVGVGMQAVGVGIPVGETSNKVINGLRDMGVPLPPKSWFKPKEKKQEQDKIVQASSPACSNTIDNDSKTPTIYDKLESHVHGVIQVVKPVIELKKMIREGCCRSAERPGPRSSHESLVNSSIYYTPQKLSSGTSFIQTPDDNLRCSSQEELQEKNLQQEDEFHASHHPKTHSKTTESAEFCMYCSSTNFLICLPCGRTICSKCDQYQDHDFKCKQCKSILQELEKKYN